MHGTCFHRARDAHDPEETDIARPQVHFFLFNLVVTAAACPPHAAQLHLRRLGRLRQQSQSEFLFHHQIQPETAQPGNTPLGSESLRLSALCCNLQKANAGRCTPCSPRSALWLRKFTHGFLLANPPPTNSRTSSKPTWNFSLTKISAAACRHKTPAAHPPGW